MDTIPSLTSESIHVDGSQPYHTRLEERRVTLRMRHVV